MCINSLPKKRAYIFLLSLCAWISSSYDHLSPNLTFHLAIRVNVNVTVSVICSCIIIGNDNAQCI